MHRVRTWALCVAVIGTLAAGATSRTASAAPADDKAKKAQIDYAKQLYGEGVAAMEAKDFDTALVKFKEAYRYAPELHLFTYNIGAAAEGSGDCYTARTYYTMFLDLVPEHPERDNVRKTVERLVEQCPEAPQSVEVISHTDDTKKKEHAEQEGEDSLREAFEAVEKAAAMYTAVASGNGGAQPFKRIGAAKQRHRKRMLKLFDSHGMTPKPPSEGGDDDTFVPDSLSEACNAAASHEKKSARLFEEAANAIGTREMWRVMNRYRRAADGRYRNAFQESCPKT